ncbi:orotate phosphoribosyltransferase [Bifidobacterium apri]|uniref:orotate phosphoribosyltransferase n=1 Tax=Bifidobacterium apri TaxID=1769423 RepID=UPI003995CA66
MTENSEHQTFRRTGSTDHRTAAAQSAGNTNEQDATAFAMLEPREQLRQVLAQAIKGKPFNELYSVAFDHRTAATVGHVLLDALEEQGYGVDDFGAVGALTAAAVPLVSAVILAAASRGEDLDGFVMDFVYPSIKGPSIAGKRVILLDAWLSEKSYVQTSSLVTLRNGNELSLDFSIVEHEGAQVLAVASLIGGVGDADHVAGERQQIEVINPVTAEHTALPLIQVFDERELNAA